MTYEELIEKIDQKLPRIQKEDIRLWLNGISNTDSGEDVRDLRDTIVKKANLTKIGSFVMASMSDPSEAGTLLGLLIADEDGGIYAAHPEIAEKVDNDSNCPSWWTPAQEEDMGGSNDECMLFLIFNPRKEILTKIAGLRKE